MRADSQGPAAVSDDAGTVPAAEDGTGPAAPASTIPGDDEVVPRSVHRLRGLDRRGRWWAAAFAGGQLLAPLLALAWALPEWAPATDTARMALRALDVGTSDTPLTGLPSTSALYVDAPRHVDHPGPVHYYLLAPAVRLLGAHVGMLVVSVAIVGTSLVIAAWAAFRQLGPSGGALAAVVLSAITFTTGAATLVNPVSSNIARYPFLCGMVLLWCLLCGDLRLMPLTAVVLTFAAQQHLSVLAPVALTSAAVAAAGAATWLRAGWQRRARDDGGGQESERQPDRPGVPGRRELVRWGGATGLVALVLWSPVLVQQLFGADGNLTRMLRFTASDERPTLGYGSGLRHVVHALGLPPIVGERNLTGGWFLEDVSLLTWASATVVVAVTASLGWRWYRQGRPRRAALVVMAAVLAVAGVVNGASIPEGIETIRLSFYHWAWPLVFFVAMSLGLAALGLVDRLAAARPHRETRVALAGVALAVVVVPSLVNPSLERESNTLWAAYTAVERRYITEVADAVMAQQGRIDEPVVLLGREESNFEGLREALALELTERGLPVRQPRSEWQSVGSRRVVDPATVQGGLVLVVDTGLSDPDEPDPVSGELIVDVDTVPDSVDREAFEALVDELEAVDEVVLGDDLEQAAAGMVPDPAARDLYMANLTDLAQGPRDKLLDRDLLRLLQEHPPEQPRLDPSLVGRVHDTLPDEPSFYRLRVFLLGRDEVLDFAEPHEIPA